jgi:hypothetical protein
MSPTNTSEHREMKLRRQDVGIVARIADNRDASAFR